MRILFSIILSFTLNGLCTSQTTSYSLKIQELMDLFGQNHQGVWIQQYSGVSKQGEAYIFTLGHNGREYRAILQNLQTQVHWTAEGAYHFENIKLVLIDSALEHTGFLLGTVTPNGILLQILDHQKEKGEYIEFQKMSREGFKIFDCPSEVWYQSYRGIMDRNPIFVQLKKENDQRVLGSISLPDKLSGYLIAGNCDDIACENMVLTVHDYYGERYKELRTKFLNPNQIQVEEDFKDKYKLTETWNAESKFHFKCKNQSYPGIRLHAEYIQINDREFDNWLDAFIQKWIEQVVSFYQSGPIRGLKSANASMDIDWINTDWVCGIFRFTEPWTDAERSLSFNFDRKLNRIVSIEELFDKEFDYKSYFAEYISWKKKEMMSINTSGRFKMYMDQEFFSPWTLRPEGFCFTSEWNSIYGIRKIIVPYALLQEHIRKTGPLRKLY